MDADGALERFLDDYERYADIINGTVFKGEQRLKGDDFSEYNSKTVTKKAELEKKKAGKTKSTRLYRDLIKRVAFGVNYAVMGIENQNEVHYLMPVRVMKYSAAEYERQAARFKKKPDKCKGISKGEFLSDFGKYDRLMPCVIIVLFYGEEWDGSRDLHELLDFTDIPEAVKAFVPNYPVNLVNIRELENTDVFKTDVKQVFDFIRCSKDKDRLRALVESDEAYRHMAEDAYDVVSLYTKANKFIGVETYVDEGGRIDMCQALEEWSKEERALGREEGREEGRSLGREEGRNLGREEGSRDMLKLISAMLKAGESQDVIGHMCTDSSFLELMRSKYLGTAVN